MLTFETLPGEAIVEATLDGQAGEKELSALREECERVAREKGGVRMLFVFERMGAVSPGAVLEGLRADLSLFRDLEKLAIVTDKDWYRTLTGVATKLFSFETRTFLLEERRARSGTRLAQGLAVDRSRSASQPASLARQPRKRS